MGRGATGLRLGRLQHGGTSGLVLGLWLWLVLWLWLWLVRLGRLQHGARAEDAVEE